MEAAAPTDFGPLIGSVARKLWGEPNKRLSKPNALRWGNQGARIVYPETGAFKDTEAGDLSGGTLDLIQHVQHVDKGGAVRWLISNGFIPDRPREHGVKLDANQRITATFEFRRNGSVRYRKHRIEPGRNGRTKDFLYDHPDGAGGWKWGRGNGEQVPYRADTLIDAEMIVMAEGEAKADRLTAWGFAATSSKDWRPEFAEYVRGKRVFILPDNDRTGDTIAREVAGRVEAAGATVSIVPLPRLADKGDVLDWDGDADELRALFEQAPVGEGPSVEEEETFPLADLRAWAKAPPIAKAFVMAPFVPRDEVVVVTGDGGVNKSTFALQLSACAVAGKPMLGMMVAPGPALYITAEDDSRENHWRLTKIAHAIGTTVNDLADRLHVGSLRGRLNNELATFESDGKLKAAPAYRLLRATIVKTGAKIVTLDNVAHLFAGNENDRQQVTAFINLLYQLCGDLGVTILLIAHRNKAGDSYSGSTAWLNAVRSQVMLERTDEHDPDARRLSLGKANYARAGETVDFRWYDFALVRDLDLSADRMADIAATAEASRENEIFLTCLRERNRQDRPVSERYSRTYAPTVFAEMAESKGIGKAKLERAMDRLFRIGAIERAILSRDKAKGRDIEGLRETGQSSPKPSPQTFPEPCPEPTPRPTPHYPQTPTPPYPYTTYRAGAASEGHAPAPDDDAPIEGWDQ